MQIVENRSRSRSTVDHLDPVLPYAIASLILTTDLSVPLISAVIKFAVCQKRQDSNKSHTAVNKGVGFAHRAYHDPLVVDHLYRVLSFAIGSLILTTDLSVP